MKKLVSVLLVCAFAIAFISSCGNDPSSADQPSAEDTPRASTSDSEPDSAALPSDESMSISIWTNFWVEADLLQAYADLWAEKTGNQATVTQNSIELQEFAQATGKAGGPDGIFGIANDQLASFVAASLAEEVPSGFYQDSDFVSAAVQASYVDGIRFGVPIAVETITLFYNTDKVESAPATWDELLETAGASGGIKFDATSIYYDLGFVRAFDGYIFKWENNQYNVDDIGLGSSGAVQAYSYIYRMVEEGSITADITFDIARSAFENGESAYYIGGPWDVDAFTSAGINFAVATMPTLNGRPFVTPVGTQVGFVSSKTEKKDAVWDFYKFLMEEAMVEMYEVGSRIPASLSVQGQVSLDDVTESFMNQIANGEPLPSVPELGLLWDPYADNMRLMFAGTISPTQAAEYIETQFAEAIEMMHSGR